MDTTTALIVTGVCTIAGSVLSAAMAYSVGFADAAKDYRATISALTKRLNEVLIIQSFPHDESRFERLMQSRTEKAPRMNVVAR